MLFGVQQWPKSTDPMRALAGLCVAGPVAAMTGALYSAMYLGFSYLGMTIATSFLKALFETAISAAKRAS